MIVVKLRYGLVGIREGHIVEAVDLGRFVGQTCIFIEAVSGKQHFLLALGGIHRPAGVFAEAHQLVAPPGERAVLGNHVTIIRTAEVQVFERELLLRQCRQSQQSQQQQRQAMSIVCFHLL